MVRPGATVRQPFQVVPVTSRSAVRSAIVPVKNMAKMFVIQHDAVK